MGEITRKVDGIEVWNALPGRCIKCGRYVYNGYRNECPHEPITDDAISFDKRIKGL